MIKYTALNGAFFSHGRLRCFEGVFPYPSDNVIKNRGKPIDYFDHSQEDIEKLVGQICYRAADFAYLLDVEPIGMSRNSLRMVSKRLWACSHCSTRMASSA